MVNFADTGNYVFSISVVFGDILEKWKKVIWWQIWILQYKIKTVMTFSHCWQCCESTLACNHWVRGAFARDLANVFHNLGWFTKTQFIVVPCKWCGAFHTKCVSQHLNPIWSWILHRQNCFHHLKLIIGLNIVILISTHQLTLLDYAEIQPTVTESSLSVCMMAEYP